MARTVFRNSEIPGRIHALLPFLSVGKLPDGTRVWSGHSGPAVTTGHLPPRLIASARAAVYVVYSYETPIAWVEEMDEAREMPYWYHVPNVGYSPTTSQQQLTCLEAWREARKRQGARGRWILDGRREVVRVPPNATAYGVPRRARSGGMDGVRPGEHAYPTRDSVYEERMEAIPEYARGEDPPDYRPGSAYEGVSGDAMHWSPGRRTQRAHP